MTYNNYKLEQVLVMTFLHSHIPNYPCLLVYGKGSWPYQNINAPLLVLSYLQVDLLSRT